MPENPPLENAINLAAHAIRTADHILIMAGAGMGVDSGLPDFRGDEGFWKAYPPFKERGLSFQDLASPVWFSKNPRQAWGFYGHRLHLYQQTIPHQGFDLLRIWAERAQSHFIFTSNVDGHFQTAGFSPDRVFECHGSFSNLQCSNTCQRTVWPIGETMVEVDLTTFLATAELPQCHSCQAVARPNILMFGDFGWVRSYADQQHERYNGWLSRIRRDGKLVVIEIGAGTGIPTVRRESESRLAAGATLIRINPRESHGPPGTLSIGLSGQAALQAIQQVI